jgi:3-methyladenine DNA glycosylase AlkD
VDQAVNNLFRKTHLAHKKAVQWAGRDEEFVKRAGYTLMAVLAVHDRDSEDSVFTRYLGLVVKASTDDRNFVKKAVNWALRQIGKRNPELWKESMETVSRIAGMDSKAARWIASDARRELDRIAHERGWSDP